MNFFQNEINCIESLIDDLTAEDMQHIFEISGLDIDCVAMAEFYLNKAKKKLINALKKYHANLYNRS